MRVNFREKAEKDLKDIMNYYKKEVGENISNDFIISLESLFTKLISFPNMGKIYKIKRNKEKVKVFGLTDFPQLIFYKFVKNKKTLEIIRILHGRRNIQKIFIK